MTHEALDSAFLEDKEKEEIKIRVLELLSLFKQSREAIEAVHQMHMLTTDKVGVTEDAI